jgi:hypothetical protein
MIRIKNSLAFFFLLILFSFGCKDEKIKSDISFYKYKLSENNKNYFETTFPKDGKKHLNYTYSNDSLEILIFECRRNYFNATFDSSAKTSTAKETIKLSGIYRYNFGFHFIIEVSGGVDGDYLTFNNFGILHRINLSNNEIKETAKYINDSLNEPIGNYTEVEILDTLTLNNTVFKSVYKITDTYTIENGDEENVKEIYINKDFGVIKLKLVNGQFAEMLL